MNAAEKNTRIQDERVASLEQMLEMTTSYMIEVERDLSEKKNELESAQKHIVNSLNYSALLQKIIQPTPSILSQSFKQHFVIDQPRDTIGGDSLWLRRSEDYTYVAILDCTGHGIPGAMLTMAAHFSLNDTFDKKTYKRAYELVKDFNQRFYQNFSLHQKGQDEIIQGLDIGLAIIDHNENELYYCGTNQSLVVTNKNDFRVYKGNKSYIGTENPTLELEYKIKINPNDVFYIYTDGVPDQFGGDRDKKLQQKRVHKMIQNILGLNLVKQKEILTSFIKEWQGTLPQTDDMLMLGFKL